MRKGSTASSFCSPGTFAEGLLGRFYIDTLVFDVAHFFGVIALFSLV